jgi:hypothetical protein
MMSGQNPRTEKRATMAHPLIRTTRAARLSSVVCAVALVACHDPPALPRAVHEVRVWDRPT